MSWWLVAGIILYNILSSEEREARERWEHKREKVERSVKDHRKYIKAHLNDAQQNCNFISLTSLHHSSVIAANAGYNSLQDARISLEAVGKMIVSTKEKRTELENNLKLARDKTEKIKIIDELKVYTELRKSLFPDKDKVKEQRNHLYKEVKRLNAETAELKRYIRDGCGQRGVDWYDRLEERTRQRNC